MASSVMLTGVCITLHQMKRLVVNKQLERKWKEAVVGGTSLARLLKKNLARQLVFRI